MKFVLLIAAAWLLLLGSVDAKIMKRCDFVHELKKNGITAKLGTWTCIAQHESEFNTAAVNSKTGDHGILQISQIYWCATGSKPGKACNATCKQFENDNIADDIACAKKIYAEHQRLKGDGFLAWVAYSKCRGNNDGYVKGC